MRQGWRRVLAGLQRVRDGRAKPEVVDAEESVSQFFRSYSVSPSSAGLRSFTQVPRAVAAVRAARTLPILTMAVSGSEEGQSIRRGLSHLGRRTHKTAYLRTPLHEVASVLILPRTPQQYATGASKQTVRRKSRAAEKAGVRWAALDDVVERRRLIALSETRERQHPHPRYRSENADNSHLLGVGLWLIAYSHQDVPLLMAVVPADGEWSMLAYFRTLEDSPAASNARYLMSWVLAEELVGRGVRYLVDTATMSNLPDGLRHFQRILGYQVVRVRLPSARRRRLLLRDVKPDASTRPPASGFEGPFEVDTVESEPDVTTSLSA